MEILAIILDGVLIVVGLIIINYIKELPILHKELTLQEKNHSHEHLLQQEAYYKQISGEKIEKLFVEWTEMFVDTEKMNGFTDKQAMELSKNVFLYGSTNTIEVFSKYINNLYTQKTEQHLNNYKTQFDLYMFADILSNLKYDFTGYKVDPLMFLKAKITDYDETFTEDAVREVKEFINTLD